MAARWARAYLAQGHPAGGDTLNLYDNGALAEAELLRATVDGPSSPDNFVGLGTVSGMRACGYGSYGAFGNSSAAYEDNVVSWPSVEPADDYSAISLLAFAYGAAGLG